ncbi:hypothetical protein MMC28_007709 [Mycoblastus sanguinarius]|nr:hypothetical protein [Mycoblastus sanguinarius]
MIGIGQPSNKKENKKLSSLSVTGKAAGRKTTKRQGGFVTFSGLPAPSFDASGCKTTVTGGPGLQAGPQVLVANSQTCSSGSYNFNINHGVSASTQLSTSKDETITNTIGGSVAIKTGVDLMAEADVTLTATYPWADAIPSRLAQVSRMALSSR